MGEELTDQAPTYHDMAQQLIIQAREQIDTDGTQTERLFSEEGRVLTYFQTIKLIQISLKARAIGKKTALALVTSAYRQLWSNRTNLTNA